MHMRILITLMTLSFCAAANADETLLSTYGSLVDEFGNISLPKDFRSDGAFLGTWSIAEEDVETSSAASGHGAAGLHTTQDYKTECLGCDIPARNDDWIYLDGYPVLETTN